MAISLGFLVFFVLLPSVSSVDLVFTVKNLGENSRFQSNLVTMLGSLLNRTKKIDQLDFHVIGDAESRRFVEKIFAEFHYEKPIDQISIDDLTEKFRTLIEPLIKQFSSGHHYYKDPLFFLSPFADRIFPREIKRLIMLDIDLRFENDVQQLNQLFDHFEPNNILGIARENQPVYRHLLWRYRQENPRTSVGNPPPDGLTGFNSGVLLLNLERMRESQEFQRFLNNVSLIEQLRNKYHFTHPHLGDQDFYSLLSFEYPNLFFILPCTWNRQLCTWWKGKGYDDVWESYFNCNNEQNIHLYHGNCNTPIPTTSSNEKKVEL